MSFSHLDWIVVLAYLAVVLGLGLWAARGAGASSSAFFLSGRNLPWWLLGLSMVATTFSTDTPNLVADITRQNGVAGNWVWWAFLLTGMLTVFVYARLWRRSGVVTDLEIYELRYSGRPAAFLRGFRAVYLGLFFNVMVMASVTLAAIKIAGVLFALTPVQAVLVAGAVAAAVSVVGGLRSVVLTDALLFVTAMAGALAAAVVAVGHPEVGGLGALMTHDAVRERLDLVPDLTDPATFVPLFLVPLAVQWWASWYPGAEPGGGGYVAQRMLAARDEGHARGATLLFNVAHYALRPWPWILVALASLVVFPDLESIRLAFPHLEPQVVGHDLAYPAMLTFLPGGWFGLVVASLAAAYVSTLSTHLNWGSSYLAHDVYRRFLRPRASEQELVRVGRASTLLLMVLAAVVALQLQSALQAFQILLQIGAGTGLLFVLRWFWWRINAWSEIVAMAVSFAVALAFYLRHRSGAPGLEPWQELLVGVGVTTVAWLAAAFLLPATDPDTLLRFCRRTRAGGPGWRQVLARDPSAVAGPWPVPRQLLAMAAGCVAVYGLMFATGSALYGRGVRALVWLAVAAVAAGALGRWLRAEGPRSSA